MDGQEWDKSTLDSSRWDIDAMLKTDAVCPSCQGFSHCVMSIPGWQAYYDPTGSKLAKSPVIRYRRCEHAKTADAAQEQQQTVGVRFLSRTFENYQENEDNADALRFCRAYANQLNDKTTTGVIIAGPPGTGKTHLAAAIVKNAFDKGLSAAMVVVPRLLEEIRESYNRTDADRRWMYRARRKRLVVLDDLGAERPSEWVREQMFLLVNDRYESMLPTVVTTNCSLVELEKRIGARTVDRLAEMCRPATIGGTSWRRKAPALFDHKGV